METVWRIAVIYIFIVLGLRALGKREFGQLSPVELVTLLIIPEIVSQALVREDFSITNALVGVSTLLVLVYLTSLLQYQSPTASNVLSSSPIVLVHNGTYLDEHLNRERVSPEEIFDAMHESGLERLEDVKWAILSPDGKIAIVGQAPQRAVISSQRRSDTSL